VQPVLPCDLASAGPFHPRLRGHRLGRKGLGDRDGGWVDPVRDLEGERMVAEWDRLLGKWDALDKRGADLNEAEKAEKARLFDEINRIEAKLKARGWTYQDDPAKPDFGTWYPPFLCC
jgi:transposase